MGNALNQDGASSGMTAPNPEVQAPVRAPTAYEPLAERSGFRRAGISSFGLSRINAHLILEAAPAPLPDPAPE